MASATSAIAISAGGGAHCAITGSGGAKCWGDNYYSELGDGKPPGREQELTPLDVQGLTSGAAAISAGGAHTCAITPSTGAVCWGANYAGQIGDSGGSVIKSPDGVVGLSS